MTNEKVNDSVRAVVRALDILMAFTVTDHELTVSELLKRVDLSRPTLYRLLYSLEENGFLVSQGEPQRFRLGPSVAHLTHVWMASQNLVDVAKPILRRLWEQTDETVALIVAQGPYRICIAELPSSQPLSFKRGVGFRERIIFGASGRALLAHGGVSIEELRRYAQGTNVNLDNYVKELELVRTRGYATSIGEMIQGAVSVAAPFFNNSGEVAGSIVVFGPSARLDADRIETLGNLLIKEAESMSALLGNSLAR